MNKRTAEKKKEQPSLEPVELTDTESVKAADERQPTVSTSEPLEDIVQLVKESTSVEAEPESTASLVETQALRIAQLENEKQGLQEALLRKQADFENYRRRMQKDKDEAIQFANHSLISELLDVLDNFERALASHQAVEESSSELKGIYEGLELVAKQFMDILSGKWGLKVIDSVGQEFDPNQHEALMMEESADYTVATVVENFQKGYLLKDRVLRPARVKVAKPST